jgi:hypothetical protein
VVAFEGNVQSGRGVPNLWRFDEPDEQLFWLVMLPPVALRKVAKFYASDNNNDYYRNTIVPDKGRAGWAPLCGRLIPIPVEWASLFLDYPDMGTTFRWIVDLIHSVNKTKRVKFQYLAQSVVYACSLASEEVRPVSTMASQWKRLILLKQTNEWAQRAWSGQSESAEGIDDALRTTPAMPPANNFASVFGGLMRTAVTVPRAPIVRGQAPHRVHPAPAGHRVTYEATEAVTAGLDVESLIRTLFAAQTTAQLALAEAQNSNLIAFHTATVQTLASKSGDKDSKMTVAKKAILQACCGHADSTSFVAPVVNLDMEVEGGTSEAIGRILRK